MEPISNHIWDGTNTLVNNCLWSRSVFHWFLFSLLALGLSPVFAADRIFDREILLNSAFQWNDREWNSISTATKIEITKKYKVQLWNEFFHDLTFLREFGPTIHEAVALIHARCKNKEDAPRSSTESSILSICGRIRELNLKSAYFYVAVNPRVSIHQGLQYLAFEIPANLWIPNVPKNEGEKISWDKSNAMRVAKMVTAKLIEQNVEIQKVVNAEYMARGCYGASVMKQKQLLCQSIGAHYLEQLFPPLSPGVRSGLNLRDRDYDYRRIVQKIRRDSDDLFFSSDIDLYRQTIEYRKHVVEIQGVKTAFATSCGLRAAAPFVMPQKLPFDQAVCESIKFQQILSPDVVSYLEKVLLDPNDHRGLSMKYNLRKLRRQGSELLTEAAETAAEDVMTALTGYFSWVVLLKRYSRLQNLNRWAWSAIHVGAFLAPSPMSVLRSVSPSPNISIRGRGITPRGESKEPSESGAASLDFAYSLLVKIRWIESFETATTFEGVGTTTEPRNRSEAYVLLKYLIEESLTNQESAVMFFSDFLPMRSQLTTEEKQNEFFFGLIEKSFRVTRESGSYLHDWWLAKGRHMTQQFLSDLGKYHGGSSGVIRSP